MKIIINVKPQFYHMLAADLQKFGVSGWDFHEIGEIELHLNKDDMGKLTISKENIKSTSVTIESSS